MLCYFYIIVILFHCPLSGPDLIYISLLIIPCIIYYVTNKETLTLTLGVCRKPSHLLRLQQSYKWTKHSKENYQSAIESQTIKLLLEKFIMNTYPQNKVGINYMVDITDIFHQSASMCNLKKSSKRNPKNTTEKWFDDISIYQTWIKILKAIIEPIALYGSEIWGPLKTQDFSKWEK